MARGPPVSLQRRLALGVALLTLLVVASFGALAYGWFVRQQMAELRRLLDEDLARVTALLDQPVLGASFTDAPVPGFVVQVVSADDRVVLAWGSDEPLPLANAPTPHLVGGHRYLVGSRPWREGGATIRIGHDLEPALRTRAELGGSLLLGGSLTFLLASLLAIGVTRRGLRPLKQVAAKARAVDPSAPAAIAYAGSDDEIRALTDALNDTLSAIGERARQERAFLLEIAHELAGPLTLVHYHLAQLRRERPAEPALGAAAAAAQELLRTSQDLLVLARGELERPLQPEIVDLCGLTERVAAEYPGVRVAPSGAAETVGDPDRLMQVVRNLVRNGVQAAGRPEGVEITLVAGADGHRIRVSDDGPGLDEEAREHVFERGFRQGRGIGVGLAISKDLVERHGGAIQVGSRPAGGATFEVWLPSLAAQRQASEKEGGP